MELVLCLACDIVFLFLVFPSLLIFSFPHSLTHSFTHPPTYELMLTQKNEKESFPSRIPITTPRQDLENMC
ncbi:MAG: hypothetical protein J3R72DRAFT_428948 [Linnemannia gamsii]|nr:MAG: hypothetical protein J3R72DRAFT_428948 [Linnemannia gamsii]